MTWQQRLREMVLAGGALTAAACSTSSSGSTFDSGVVDARSGPGNDAADDVAMINFCCNANPDPCCAYLHCDASLTMACSQEMACETEGGTWDGNSEECSFGHDGGSSDAVAGDSATDASSGDASTDGPADAPVDGNGHD
jgi:hypothetical protein